MAQPPRDYETLHEAQRTGDSLQPSVEGTDTKTVTVDTNARSNPAEIGAESSPSGPEEHYAGRTDWTDRGGMVEQQASANDMVKRHYAERQGAQDDRQVDNPGQNPSEASARAAARADALEKREEQMAQDRSSERDAGDLEK